MLQRKIEQVREKARDEGGQERASEEVTFARRPERSEGVGSHADMGGGRGGDSGLREQHMQKLRAQSMAGEFEEEQGGQSGWSEGSKGETRRRREIMRGLPYLRILRVCAGRSFRLNSFPIS